MLRRIQTAVLFSTLVQAVAVDRTSIAARQSDGASAPTVQLQNGSYYGIFNQEYDQDEFLGMPYAAPPVGDLRFQVPQPYNASWEEARNATEYSPQCFGMFSAVLPDAWYGLSGHSC